MEYFLFNLKTVLVVCAYIAGACFLAIHGYDKLAGLTLCILAGESFSFVSKPKDKENENS